MFVIKFFHGIYGSLRKEKWLQVSFERPTWNLKKNFIIQEWYKNYFLIETDNRNFQCTLEKSLVDRQNKLLLNFRLLMSS